MMVNEPSFGARFLLSEFIFILVVMFPSQRSFGDQYLYFSCVCRRFCCHQDVECRFTVVTFCSFNNEKLYFTTYTFFMYIFLDNHWN